MHDKSDQNYLTKLLKNQYDLEFSLTPEISYSILPKPHFQINDVVIFNNIENFQKEIAQVKKLKIYLTQKNFLKKRQLKIKSVELYQTNFFINQTDINFLKEFLIKGFKASKSTSVPKPSPVGALTLPLSIVKLLETGSTSRY